MPKLAVVRTQASPHTALGMEDAHEQRTALRLAPVVSVQVRSYDLNPTQPITEVGRIRTTNAFPSLGCLVCGFVFLGGGGELVLFCCFFGGIFLD